MANKATIRNYMELLRDLSNSKGRISVSRYATKHHVSQAVTVSLGKLGYIKCGGGPSGSVWIGPKIASEDDLRIFADLVMKTSNKYNLDALRKRTANQVRKHSAKRVPAKATESHRPVRTINILWGLFKFTY